MWQVIDLVIHELYYLAFTALGIALGVLVMNYVMGRESVVRLVDRLGRWVTRLSGLPGYCSLPFVVSLVSPSTASSMLVAMYRDGRLTRRELYVASLINAFPALLSHLRTLVPVLLSTMGVYGLAYLSILMAIGLAQMLIFAIIGRRYAAGGKGVAGSAGLVSGNVLSLRRALRLIVRMVVVTAVTSAAFTVVMGLGIDQYINDYLSHAFSALNPYVVGLIVAYMVSDSAAFAAAGTLISNGFSGTLVIRWLLLGYVVSSLVRGVRHNAPYYLGIYGFRDGVAILLISILTRALLALVVLGVLWLV